MACRALLSTRAFLASRSGGSRRARGSRGSRGSCGAYAHWPLRAYYREAVVSTWTGGSSFSHWTNRSLYSGGRALRTLRPLRTWSCGHRSSRPCGSKIRGGSWRSGGASHCGYKAPRSWLGPDEHRIDEATHFPLFIPTNLREQCNSIFTNRADSEANQRHPAFVGTICCHVF